MKESRIVKHIELQLYNVGLYYINVHGSVYSRSGTPDIVLVDNTGVFTAIEAKAPGNKPAINQVRHGLMILKSGGRFIIAYDDYNAQRMLRHELPVVTLQPDDSSELAVYEHMAHRKAETYEVKLADANV